MGIPGHEDSSASPGQRQHCLDTKGTAASAEKRPGSTELFGSRLLRLFYPIPSIVKAAGIRQFRQIQQWIGAIIQSPFMPRSMK